MAHEALQIHLHAASPAAEAAAPAAAPAAAASSKAAAAAISAAAPRGSIPRATPIPAGAAPCRSQHTSESPIVRAGHPDARITACNLLRN